MSLRSRLERLERRQPAPVSRRVSIWDVLCGGADPADLDDASLALLQQALDADVTRDPIEEAVAAALAGLAVPPPLHTQG